MAILSGINPVLESLKAGRPLDRILVAKGAAGARLQEIIDLARRASVSESLNPSSMTYSKVTRRALLRPG